MASKKKKLYRSQTEIITNILTAIKKEKDGVRITRLMSLSGLSTTQLKKYLIMLDENGLIVKGATIKRGSRGLPGQTFHITTKGLSYLQMVDEMRQNMGIKI